MCDQATETKIRDTIKDFVNRGIMFGAYDVTKTLRGDGTKISHHDVQEVVRDMYSNGEMGIYERDTVDVGAPVKPFIYYHPNSDLSQYDKDWVTNNPKQSVSAPVAPSAPSAPSAASATFILHCFKVVNPVLFSSVTTGTGTATGTKFVTVATKENRIEIPTVLVKLTATPTTAIHLQKGVSIDQNGNKVSKVLLEASTNPNGCPYRVSKDGRLRLHVSHIANHLGVRSQYNVYAENGKIIVE